MGSYLAKAVVDTAAHASDFGAHKVRSEKNPFSKSLAVQSHMKASKRLEGIGKAITKVTKEEAEPVDEGWRSGTAKAVGVAAHTAGLAASFYALAKGHPAAAMAGAIGSGVAHGVAANVGSKWERNASYKKWDKTLKAHDAAHAAKKAGIKEETEEGVDNVILSEAFSRAHFQAGVNHVLSAPDSLRAALTKSHSDFYSSVHPGFKPERFSSAVARGTMYKEKDSLPALSRKSFEAAASHVKGIQDKDVRTHMHSHMSSMGKRSNPRFDTARFSKAAGVVKEDTEILSDKIGSITQSIMTEKKIIASVIAALPEEHTHEQFVEAVTQYVTANNLDEKWIGRAAKAVAWGYTPVLGAAAVHHASAGNYKAAAMNVGAIALSHGIKSVTAAVDGAADHVRDMNKKTISKAKTYVAKGKALGFK